MSCLASPELLLLALLFTLLPILLGLFFLRCSKRWKALFFFVSLLADLFIILNQGKLCENFQIGCSIFFSLGVILVVPSVIYGVFAWRCRHRSLEGVEIEAHERNL